MINIKVRELKGKNKARGLIGIKKAYPVFFQTRFGIHTFGLKFPIDVLILDKESRVVKFCENLKPNRIFLWNPQFNSVIELPAGEIKRLNLKIREKISIEVAK